MDLSKGPAHESHGLHSCTQRFIAALKETILYMRFIITNGAFIGPAPYDRQVLYFLREKGDGNFQSIGESYVHGVMDGEAMEMYDGNKKSSKTLMVELSPSFKSEVLLRI